MKKLAVIVICGLLAAAGRAAKYPMYWDSAAGTYVWGTTTVDLLAGAVQPGDVPWLETNTLSLVVLPTEAYCVGNWRNEIYWRPYAEPRYRGFTTAVTSTVADAVQVDYEADGQFLDAQIEIDYLRGWTDIDPAYTVTPVGIASISGSGYITTSNAGLAAVGITIDTVSKSLPVALSYAQGALYGAWVRGASNSIRRASGDLLDTTIAAAGPSPDIELLSVTDHAAGNYALNTNAWSYGLADLSGVPISTKHPSGGWGAPQWSGTLISPRHVELSKHTVSNVPNQLASNPEEIGTKKRFLGRSGMLYERTVIAHFDPFGDAPAYTNLTAWNLGQDTIIGLLDAAVPTNDVAVYPVLPADWRDYSPSLLRARPINVWPQVYTQGGAAGALWVNQDLHVYGIELSSVGGFLSTPWPPRAAVHRVGRVGDSARPVFLWLPDQLVFLSTLTMPTHGHNWAAVDPDTGTMYSDNRARVEAILALHGETLTDADLSDYATFEEPE